MTSLGVQNNTTPLMADLMPHALKPFSFAAGSVSRWIGCWIHLTILVIQPGRSPYASSFWMWTAFCAAMDCSTKSRAREIPRAFDDGRPAPRPLRSMEYPEGLPDLSPAEDERVRVDNTACSFILTETQNLASRGGASVREPLGRVYTGISLRKKR